MSRTAFLAMSLLALSLLAVAGCAPSHSPDEQFSQAIAATPAGTMAPPLAMRQAGRSACEAGRRADGFDEQAAWDAANRSLGLDPADGRGYDVASTARSIYCP